MVLSSRTIRMSSKKGLTIFFAKGSYNNYFGRRAFSEVPLPSSLSSAAWKRLAALTNDPAIQQVSKTVSSKEHHGALPKTMTLAMKDSRPCMILSMEDVNHNDYYHQADHLGSSSLEHNPPHTVVNVNDAFTRLSGYTREESLNRSMESLLWGPETEQVEEGLIFDKVEEGRKSTVAQGVITHYARNGRKFHDLLRMGTIVSGDGSSRYLLCVMHEIANNNNGVLETTTTA